MVETFDSKHYRQMQVAVSQWVSLTDLQSERLAATFQLRKVGDRQHILLPGTTKHEIYFVCEGLLRFYYLSDKGAESNKAFVAENTFAGSLAAAALNLPVIYGIQALEPTTFLAARYDNFTALFSLDPAFERLGRKFAEWLLVRKELRMRSLLQQTATERYLSFIEQHPDVGDRVPQYHLASYLGITEVSLSRIKSNLAKQAS